MAGAFWGKRKIFFLVGIREKLYIIPGRCGVEEDIKHPHPFPTTKGEHGAARECRYVESEDLNQYGRRENQRRESRSLKAGCFRLHIYGY